MFISPFPAQYDLRSMFVNVFCQLAGACLLGKHAHKIGAVSVLRQTRIGHDIDIQL